MIDVDENDSPSLHLLFTFNFLPPPSAPAPVAAFKVNNGINFVNHNLTQVMIISN